MLIETFSDDNETLMLSVVICTYNRADLLRGALESVAVSIFPSAVQWEVLVVDNNSTDATWKTVEAIASKHPKRFRYVLEKQQGLSSARNAGVREARGEIIVFTDDDITVDENWLWNLTSEMRDAKWAGAGGRVVPVWTCTAPKWFPVKRPWGAIVQFDRGDTAGALFEPPLGANMAFRKEVINKYGGFRTDLGRCGDSLMSSEDIEFGRRLLNAGEKLRYEPSSVVYHPVPENRLTKDYVLSWWFDRARSDVRESGIRANSTPRILGIPFNLFPKFALWTVRWLLSIGSARRFDAKLTLWNIAGAIREHFVQSRKSGAMHPPVLSR